MVTYEQWRNAQVYERKAHTYPIDKALKVYEQSYAQYFKYLGIKHNQHKKKILEIGCADIPALYFCDNFIGTVIEPMPSPILTELCTKKHIYLIQDMAETCRWPADIDEIWLLYPHDDEIFQSLRHYLVQ